MQKKRKSLFAVLLAVALLMVTLSSCSDNSSPSKDPNLPENLILGTWKEYNNDVFVFVFENDGRGRSCYDSCFQTRCYHRFSYSIFPNNTLSLGFDIDNNRTTILNWADDNNNVRFNEWYVTEQYLNFGGLIFIRH